jgi:hypothetical protein
MSFAGGSYLNQLQLDFRNNKETYLAGIEEWC